MKRSFYPGLLVCGAAVMLLAGCSVAENTPLGADGAPKEVTAAFKKSYPDAKIVDVRKKVYKDGRVKYDVEYTDAVGEKHDVNYDGNGIMVR